MNENTLPSAQLVKVVILGGTKMGNPEQLTSLSGDKNSIYFIKLKLNEIIHAKNVLVTENYCGIFHYDLHHHQY